MQKQSKFSLPVLSACYTYCVILISALAAYAVYIKGLASGPMTLASKVQALALRVGALVLRFWP